LKPTAVQLQALLDFVAQIYPLPDNDREAFSAIWETVTVKRKTVLRSPGETERNLYFVLEGVQRAFHIDEEEHEQTIVFTYPYSFSGIADSFLTQTPTPYFLETLTPTVLLKTSYNQLSCLMEQSHAIERMILKTTAFALKGVIERQIELGSYAAEKKFTILLHRSPHLLQIIPHKYLASYLGIDPATFSKLMGRVRL
jgi:CRP-like cAMP-binding protein